MKLLKDIPKNARYALMVQPMWTVWGSTVLFYSPLYMKEIGLTEIQIGIISTVNIFVSFIFYILAGPVTNRLGRKKTTFVFDTVAWVIPMFMWAVAKDFWCFLIPSIINASSKVVFISWNCLITEDTEKSKRAKVFGVTYIINISSGVTTIIAGLIMNKLGFVITLRWIYLIGMISMAAMFYIRNSLVVETKIGMELMKKHSGLPVLQIIKRYNSTIINIFRNRSIVLIIIIYVFTSFVLSINNTVQIIFIKDFLKFNEVEVSLIPCINALICILIFGLIMPRIKGKAEERILFYSLAVMVLGSFMFLFIPKSRLSFMLLSNAILAAGNFSMQTYRDSVVMNTSESDKKAEVFSAVQTLAAFSSIPSGFLAGYTYSINPYIPFILVVILLCISMIVSFILVLLSKIWKRKNDTYSFFG